MITVCSGVPGSGKTAFVVDQLLNSKEYKDRRLLTNIDGLIRDNTEFISSEELNKWYEICQPNDVIAFDEFQYAWPKRASNTKVPPAVAELDVHRHHGVDFFLITQGFGKIDQQLKTGEVVGQHYHFWDSGLLTMFGYRNKTSWLHLEQNPISAIKRGKTSLYKPPRRVFKYYKSAEAHTKPKVEKARVLYVILFALLFAAYFVYQSMQNNKERFTAHNNSQESQQQTQLSSPPQSVGVFTGSFDPKLLDPVDSRYPESMPIFDGARPLKAVRQIRGCMKSSKSKTCKCFDADGVLIKDTDLATCEAFLSGEYYTPFSSQSGSQGQPVAQKQTDSVQGQTPPPPPSPQLRKPPTIGQEDSGVKAY